MARVLRTDRGVLQSASRGFHLEGEAFVREVCTVPLSWSRVALLDSVSFAADERSSAWGVPELADIAIHGFTSERRLWIHLPCASSPEQNAQPVTTENAGK